jgi:hypothetical protein
VAPQPFYELNAALLEGSRALRDSVAGVSEDDALVKPDPASWSVRDCVEHLVLVERGLAGRVMAAEPSEPLPEDPARAARGSRVADRSAKVEAPEHVRPTGRFATVAEALEAFDAARRDTLAFVAAHHADLGARTIRHPAFGPLTGHEALRVLASHVHRHVAQIREIRASHIS